MNYNSNKKQKTLGTFALVFIILLVIPLLAMLFKSPISSGSSNNTKLKTFTAQADEYKDLQRFVEWVDSEGNSISTSPTYKYRATEEKELTAVYDNIDFVIKSGSSSWDSSTHTLTGSKWTDINYLEYGLKKGMSVTFNWNLQGNSLVGLSTTEQLNATSDNSWVVSSSISLFAPKYNMYFGSDQTSWKYITKTGNPNYTDCSIPFSKELVGQSVKVKYVLADKIEMYIEDVLVETTLSDVSFSYDENDTYYFTYWATTGSITLLEFGWDVDSSQVFKGLALASDYYSGKKITFLGDSITAGVGATDSTTERYSTVLSSTLSATENNMGNSGWVICEGGVRSSQLQNISKIPMDSDLVIVMLGTNDQNLASSTQYTLGNDGDTTTTTVWGATETMCKQLAERFKDTNTKVIICTPPIQKGYSNDRVNGANYSLRDISNVLITCAKRNGLLYADLNNSGYLTDDDMNDVLHPNTSGHSKIALFLAKYILSGYEYYVPYKTNK